MIKLTRSWAGKWFSQLLHIEDSPERTNARLLEFFKA